MMCAARRDSATLPWEADSGDAQESPESPGGNPCASLKDEMRPVKSSKLVAVNHMIGHNYRGSVFH